MNIPRRSLLAAWAVAVAALVPLSAIAASTSVEAADGLRAALRQASAAAVSNLGRADGFFGNPEVRIPLPGKLQKARKTLRRIGLKKETDALELAMNRAAEAAVPEANALFVEAISQMSIADAASIVTGKEDAATEHFRRTMSDRLAERFQPIVGNATRDLQLAKVYDEVASRGSALGLVDERDASLDSYVTRKALDGLFLMMAREEAAIRRDPLGQANALLQRVFGGSKGTR